MNWENGIYEPAIADMIKLADLFDVTLDYLVGREYDADEAAAATSWNGWTNRSS